MRLALPLLAALVFAPAASTAPAPQQEDDVLNEYELMIKADHWKGFKEGSWVQRRLTKKQSTGGDTNAEYRITIDRIAENGYCFKIETIKDGKVAQTKLTVKQVYGDPTAVFESEKKEEFKVGDKAFTCFLQEYKTEGDNATLQRTLECKDAPGVIVMTMYETTYEGKTIAMKQQIVALDVEHAVDEKTKVKCWKVEKTTDMPKSKITALFSKGVPGGVVHREASNEWGEYKMTSSDVVVGFEVKQ